MKKLLNHLLFLSIVSILAGPLAALPLGVPGVNVYLTDIFVIGICFLWLVDPKGLFSLGKKDKVFFHFLIFVSLAFLSFLFSPIFLTWSERIISLLYLIRFIAYFTVYLTVLYLAKSKIIRPESLVKCLGCVGLGLSILGWIQYFLYPDLRNLYYLGWDPHYRRIFGSFLDPNYLGLMIVLALLAPFSLENLQRKCHPEFILGSLLKRMLKRVQHDTIFVWMIKCFLFVTLMFTYSRSSFLALTASALYLSVIRKKILILGLVLFILALSAAFLPRPGGEGVKLERVFSIEQRIENWRLGYRIFLRHPLLGVGFNTTRFAKREQGSPQEDWLTNHSGAGFENSFLFVLVTTGIVGFTSYLLLLRQIFKSGNLITKTSLIAIITHSLFLNSLFFPWVMLWMWVVTGIREEENC